NLSSANLSHTTLKSANLSSAALSSAALSYAKLGNATLSHANLSGANLRSANLSGANLRNADLSGANLRNADLKDADLSGANLSGADLSNADLLRTQGLGSNFAGAILTGACIEDWNTNSETNLNSTLCDYIYLKDKQQERRPAQDNFAPGDFTRLFQKARETVDLTFYRGIDWRSFAATLRTIREEQIILNPDNPKANITARAIETLDDGSFLIRVNVPENLDKAQLEAQFQEKYEALLAISEQEDRDNLQVEDEQLEIERRQSASLEYIIDVLATVTTTSSSTSEAPPTEKPAPKTSPVGSKALPPPTLPPNTTKERTTPQSNGSRSPHESKA
ncbi:MAG: pentapeptide repeat-containing protein, partial [Cyanobacteria bacterium J06641_5]